MNWKLPNGAAFIALMLIWCNAAPTAELRKTCVGEPMSGRAYNHRVAGVDVDSGVGDGCFFNAYGPIGRQIEKTCHIGDLGRDEAEGQRCRIEAVVVGDVIRRILKIERLGEPIAEPPGHVYCALTGTTMTVEQAKTKCR
jgi:hypothetical protein